nr:hypothetical protein [Leptospira stimsonii]
MLPEQVVLELLTLSDEASMASVKVTEIEVFVPTNKSPSYGRECRIPGAATSVLAEVLKFVVTVAVSLLPLSSMIESSTRILYWLEIAKWSAGSKRKVLLLAPKGDVGAEFIRTQVTKLSAERPTEPEQLLSAVFVVTESFITTLENTIVKLALTGILAAL